MIHITVKPPFRDLLGRFARADQALAEQKRESLRRLGRRWVELARDEAPEKTGKFKKGLAFKTFQRGKDLILKGYEPQPLGRWIRKGTPAHAIVAHGHALRFFWAKGPRGAKTYYFPRVQHPGTKPNPYDERAMARFRPEATAELRRMAQRWVMAVGTRSG